MDQSINIMNEYLTNDLVSFSSLSAHRNKIIDMIWWCSSYRPFSLTFVFRLKNEQSSVPGNDRI